MAAKKDLKQLIESGMCGEMPAGLGDTVYICSADKNGIDESNKIAIDLKEAANDDGQASNPFNSLDTILRPIMDRDGKENLRRINEAMNKQPMMVYVPKMTDGQQYADIAPQLQEMSPLQCYQLGTMHGANTLVKQIWHKADDHPSNRHPYPVLNPDSDEMAFAYYDQYTGWVFDRIFDQGIHMLWLDIEKILPNKK